MSFSTTYNILEGSNKLNSIHFDQNTATATAAASVRLRSLICKLSRAASAIY